MTRSFPPSQTNSLPSSERKGGWGDLCIAGGASRPQRGTFRGTAARGPGGDNFESWLDEFGDEDEEVREGLIGSGRGGAG